MTNNGRQFDSAEFRGFLSEFGINGTRVAVAYPQANGQVENVNMTILDGLKKKLISVGWSWLDELPYILWVNRTTLRRAMGETPYALTYRFEARLLVEATVPTIREEEFSPEDNETRMKIEIEFRDERRDQATTKMVEYQ